MADLARLTEMARTDAVVAAKAFIGQLGPADRPVLERIIDAALWAEKDLRSFDAEKPVLIEGKWGRFWFAPVRNVDLEKTAPVITPRGMKALAKGVVDLLSRAA
jgi:hypothetical protein